MHGFSVNTILFSANKDYGSASIDYFSATMFLMILSLSVLIRQENNPSRSDSRGCGGSI